MKKKNYFSKSLTVVLAITAIVIAALVIRREFFYQSEQESKAIINWHDLEFQTLPKSNSSSLNLPVQIIKFYDYQCSFCEKVQSSVRSVLKRYPESVSIYYAHLPLKSHKDAYKAAIAVECARNQGRFSNYDSLLFVHQDQIGLLSYVDLAIEAKVQDDHLFSKCVENEETKLIVEKGMQLANELEIVSVPTFIINGQIIRGAVTEEYLRDIIEEELARER